MWALPKYSKSDFWDSDGRLEFYSSAKDNKRARVTCKENKKKKKLNIFVKLLRKAMCEGEELSPAEINRRPALSYSEAIQSCKPKNLYTFNSPLNASDLYYTDFGTVPKWHRTNDTQVVIPQLKIWLGYTRINRTHYTDGQTPTRYGL